jgi:hypothetical protein
MTEALKTWRNLTDLRGIAKSHGIVRPNTKQIPQLLEELAQLDVAVSEVCESEMEMEMESAVESEVESQIEESTIKENQIVDNQTVSEVTEEKGTNEAEVPRKKGTNEAETPCKKVIETPAQKVARLSAEANTLSEKLKATNKELAKAINHEYESRSAPKTHAQLLKEQWAQDAKARENAKTVDAVASAQAKFLAGRERDARENMNKIMAEQIKKRG